MYKTRNWTKEKIRKPEKVSLKRNELITTTNWNKTFSERLIFFISTFKAERTSLLYITTVPTKEQYYKVVKIWFLFSYSQTESWVRLKKLVLLAFLKIFGVHAMFFFRSPIVWRTSSSGKWIHSRKWLQGRKKYHVQMQQRLLAEGTAGQDLWWGDWKLDRGSTNLRRYKPILKKVVFTI